MCHALRILAAIVASMLGVASAQAEIDKTLTLAVGPPGSDSFAFGTELWAMSQITLLPKHGIELEARHVAADEDRLSSLGGREVEAALVYRSVPERYDVNLRSIMGLWPDGISEPGSDPVQLLVHKDVDEDVVYHLTKAMFEHPRYFKSVHARLGIGAIREAVTGLDMPLHDGAYRYYLEHGFGLEAGDDAVGRETSEVPAVDAPSTAAVRSFRDFDDADLAPEEVEQITAACRQALELGSLSAVIGDLETTGCEIYRDEMVADTPPEPRGAGRTPVSPPEPEIPPAGALPTIDAAAGLFEESAGRGGPAIRWAPSEEETGSARGPSPSLPVRAVRQPTM